MHSDAIGRQDPAIDDAIRAARNITGSGESSVAENFQTAVDRSVSQQPFTTLALAAFVGFALGAIWKA